MKFDGNDIVSPLQYNDTADVSTPNYSITARKKQPEMQHKAKKKKARFFEQFCEYINLISSQLNYSEIMSYIVQTSSYFFRIINMLFHDSYQNDVTYLISIGSIK